MTPDLRRSQQIKDIKAKAGVVRSGPLTPWERLKLIAYGNALTEDLGMKEQEAAVLRAKCAELENLVTLVERGELTQEQANQKMEEIKNRAMNEDNLNQEIGRKAIQQTKNNVAQQHDFVNEVQNAKMALELAVSTFRKSSIDFIDEMTKYLTDIRATKMALGTETRQLIAQCQDVRTFFISPEHTAEVQRLKEFVEVCERLKALKESGFLDSVADTILKLEAR